MGKGENKEPLGKRNPKSIPLSLKHVSYTARNIIIDAIKGNSNLALVKYPLM